MNQLTQQLASLIKENESLKHKVTTQQPPAHTTPSVSAQEAQTTSTPLSADTLIPLFHQTIQPTLQSHFALLEAKFENQFGQLRVALDSHMAEQGGWFLT